MSFCSLAVVAAEWHDRHSMVKSFLSDSKIEFRFSSARREDAERVVDLVNSVYRGESGARSWTGEAHLLGGQRVDADQVRDLILASRSRVLIATAFWAGRDVDTDVAEIVGCVHVRVEDRGGGTVGYLGMLASHVDLQRSGLGGRLVQEAERVLHDEMGCPSVEMTVISVRHELLEWYKRRGYVETGEKRPFPYGDARFGIPKRPDLEFVVLRKMLV